VRRLLILLPIVALVGAFVSPIPGIATVSVPLSDTTTLAAPPGVDPSNVDVTLLPGQSTTIAKHVTTEPIATNPDIVFLADTTSSMGGALTDVKNNADSIIGTVHAVQPTAWFGVAAYKDEGDSYLFKRETNITDVTEQAGIDLVKAGIGAWLPPAGGGDTPESAINALYELATGTTAAEAMTYRSHDTKIVVWFGDVASHDPSHDHTLSQTIAALRAAKIRVVAVSVGSLGLDEAVDELDPDGNPVHLADAGQASAIVDKDTGTNGVLLKAADDQVAKEIIHGIQTITSTVTPHVFNCDPHLNVNNAPPSQPVTSGDTANFNETITVANGTAPGVYHCAVDYLVDEQSYIENITVRVNAPPRPSTGGPYSGNQNTDIPIAGTVADPDGPSLSTAWSITPTGDVPANSHCLFGNAAALSTTVTCDQHGTYILTLTANDGFNPPVSDSTTVTVRNVPPTVSAGGPYTGNEDNDVAIAGTVTDPDGPSLTTAWSIAPAGVCTFGNAAAIPTTVNCTERGTYTLTLTASDGFNPPVSDSTTVTFKNVPPAPSAGGPYSGNEDNDIGIAGTVTDPDGPGLTTSWSIAAIDVPVPFTCTFGDAAALSTTVNCSEHGNYTLTLTANDGVNPPVSVTTTVTFKNVPPTVSPGGPYNGNEDNDIPIAGTVTDPDGPPATITWSIERGNDVPAVATCTFGNAAALATTVNCTDHGTYTLTLTVTDGVNPPVSATTTLTLINVAPVVSAGGPYSGEEDHPVTIVGTVVDPDSPELTTTWTIKPNLGTAICSFTDATQLSTVVTCSEPGVYTLTLTVNDQVNPPVVATAVVLLSLTPGALSLISSVGPVPGYVGGDPIVVTETVHNAGPAAMTVVRLTTTMPAGLTPTSVSVNGCAATCDLGTLAAGQTVEVKFSFAPTAPADLTVSAAVDTAGPDLDRGDNAGKVRLVVRQPTLAVDPSMGPQGFVTHVTGKDFPAGARIRLQWSIGISESPGELTVRPDGTLDGQALVFPKDTKGLRNLQAVSVAGPAFGMVTANPFLVYPRSLKPLDFVIR
jgi:hypothetical protein